MSDELEHTTAIFAFQDASGKPNAKRQAVLLVMTGPTTGQMVYLETKNKWILGRANECDLSFHDQGVSRQHCTVSFDAAQEKWFVEDLGSSNGTWVNGERISKHALGGSEKIQLGSSIIVKFVFQDDLEAAFQSQLYESATKDSLTGLFSKRYFLDQLDIEFNFHRRVKKPLTLVLADVDFFKKVNDTFGHQAGDMVLRDIGRLFLNVLRKGDVIGRYGGEEIIFLLRETPLTGAHTFAERLRMLVENHPFVFDGRKIPVTISLGLATFVDDNFKSYTDLIKSADDYLYRAKQGGRNRVCSQMDK